VLLSQGMREEAQQLLHRALEQGCEHPDHVQALIDEIDKEQ